MEDQKINKRIAIIGAGAAGLTAAEALKEKGYKHITLFEKTDHVGGKCSTTKINEHLYELGAGIVAENNQAVLQLVKKFDVPIKRVEFGKSILVDSKTGETLIKKSILHSLVLLKQLLFTYRRLLNKYPQIAEPGFSKIDSDLSLSFSDFAKKYKIELLAKEFELFFTGYGYGYFDEIPTAYVLKYYCWDTIKAFAKRKIYSFPNGIQNLWTVIAEDHDVRLNTVIQSIKRGDVITIVTNKESLEFDKLLITSPLDEALDYLSDDQKEKELFSKIRYVNYRTVACSINGFKKVSGYVPNNFSTTKSSSPVFWHYRHATSDIYTFYVLADSETSDDQVVQNIESLVKKMRGVITKVYTISKWKYFPHINSAVIKNGYYDTLETLQGNHQTYYAGELMNFSTVGLTAEYSKELIKRFF